MARIRSIHPGLFTDEAFLALSNAARVLYIGILTEADDHGIFEWKPIRLKMRILPANNCSVEEILGELSGLTGTEPPIKQFEVDGKQYGAVRNFGKWQRPKAPQYIFPFPDDIASYVAFSISEEKPSRGTALGRMLCEHQNGKCFYCRSTITFHRKKLHSLDIDHKIPISKGGDDAVDNLVAACKPCNALKRNMTDEEFLARFSRSELAANCSSQRATIGDTDRSHSANGGESSHSHDANGCDNDFRTERIALSHDATAQSRSAPMTAQSANDATHFAKTATREATFQREDGGKKDRLQGKDDLKLKEPLNTVRGRG